MIFLGRGLKNHFGPRHRCECEADKTAPLANSSVTWHARGVYRDAVGIMVWKIKLREMGGTHGADLYR